MNRGTEMVQHEKKGLDHHHPYKCLVRMVPACVCSTEEAEPEDPESKVAG